jgi:hypothetical protein
MRADFLQEAEASWADYLATGLHLTGAEICGWLATWGTSAEIEMPLPHGHTKFNHKGHKEHEVKK